MLLVLGLLVGTASVWGDEANPMRAPRHLLQQANAAAQPPARSLPAAALDGLLQFYQRVISPVDGARSNMYPTGSAYARQAIQKHGALLGIVLTSERLLHEGNERTVAPRIRKYGVWRIYDPVTANTWWWNGADNWVYQPRSSAVRTR